MDRKLYLIKGNRPLSEEEQKREEIRRLKTSFLYSSLFVALLWAGKLLEEGLGLELAVFGILPGKVMGLLGIGTAPLIHGDFLHLFSNSVPFIVLGTGMLYLYRESSLRAFVIIYLLGGLGVWVIARPVYHIGASGLNYGMVTFIFFSGIFRRQPQAVALSLLVTFLYGGMLYGVLPIEKGVSWESHLSGALVGIFCAILFRKYDLPPEPEREEEDEYEYEDYN